MGGMPTLKTKPGEPYLRYSTSSLRPAMKPPQPHMALLRVLIHMSTSLASMPKYSCTPRPVAPSTPKEWASSTSSMQSYFFFSSMMRGRSGMLPSMLNRPSVTMQARLCLPRCSLSIFSRASQSLCS